MNQSTKPTVYANQPTISTQKELVVSMRQDGKPYSKIKTALSAVGIDVTIEGIRGFVFRDCKGAI